MIAMNQLPSPRDLVICSCVTVSVSMRSQYAWENERGGGGVSTIRKGLGEEAGVSDLLRVLYRRKCL
jgi:hypothetical protein